MQDRIRSKYDDWELLELSAENQVYKCFELIGIFEQYNQVDLSKDDFENYYLRCVDEKRFYYRNLGIRVIHVQLDENYIGYRKSKFCISKRSMRQFGKTYKGEPVVVYEGSYIVLQKVLAYIMDTPTMQEIYIRHIHRTDLQDYLDFQKRCLDNYIAAGGRERQNYYAQQVRQKLIELINNIRS